MVFYGAMFFNHKSILTTVFNQLMENQLIGGYIDQSKYTKACTTLDNCFKNAFQYTVLGNLHDRLKSTNLLERLNKEVRRRKKIIRIFLNHMLANRLIGAVLMDLHDE